MHLLGICARVCDQPFLFPHSLQFWKVGPMHCFAPVSTACLVFVGQNRNYIHPLRKGHFMKPYVLAVDVGKGKSKIGLFGLDTATMRTTKIMKPRDFRHSFEDLDTIGKSIGDIPMDQIGIMMESTYVYQNPVVEYFRRKGFDEITVINPLKIKKTCGDIQKVKTDKIDCGRIAAYYYFSQWEKPLDVSQGQREARELSRHLDTLQREATAIRNRIRQHLSNVFPELEKIGDKKKGFFNVGFLNLIEKTPHPLSIMKKTKAGIISVMAGKGRKDPSYAEYAALIIEAAKTSLFSAPEGGIESRLILPNLVRRLRDLQEQIKDGEDMLESMTKEMPLFAVLQSFDGIGKRIASHLTAEIWSTEQYATPQKLIASAGINPARNQSSVSVDRYGKIVKAGNRYVRHWLFIAIGCIVEQNGAGRGDKRIAEYYIKKHSSEGNHHYVATIACANKLLRQVFYRSRDLAKTGSLVEK